MEFYQCNNVSSVNQSLAEFGLFKTNYECLTTTIMHQMFLVLSLAMVLITLNLISCAPARKSLRAQINPNYVRAMAAYKRLEPKLPRQELRAITTIGILNGALQAEQQMEHHLVEVVKDLLLNTDNTQSADMKPKIVSIEKQLTRDQRAIEILTSAMDLVTSKKSAKRFKHDMQHKLLKMKSEPVKLPLDNNQVGFGADIGEGKNEDKDDMEQRVVALRRNILQHVNNMKQLVEEKIEHTLDYLIEEAAEDGLLAKASNKIVRKRHADDLREEPAEIRMIKSILTEDDFRNNLIDVGIGKRQDQAASLEADELDLDELSKKVRNSRPSSTTTTSTISTTTTTITTAMSDLSKPAKQEEGSPEITINGEQGGGGGGLVGIISSLSGGEGGSDVGALIGALTGLVSTLFGPGGLDIEALISTATSLISGLLAGNKNFGTVLGQYVGTAFDGLSGGGGAINNGQFIGNFLGTVVASLSADPEDDDVPPKPLLFAQNLISSFMEAKNRKASGEVSEERNGGKPPASAAGGGGSDSVGFIKHVVSHLVGSAVSLILNASLGASGGASRASSSLFAGSSGGHMPEAEYHNIKSW